MQECIVVDGILRKQADLCAVIEGVVLKGGIIAAVGIRGIGAVIDQAGYRARLGSISIHDTEDARAVIADVVHFQRQLGSDFMLEPEVPANNLWRLDVVGEDVGENEATVEGAGVEIGYYRGRRQLRRGDLT